jgi:hypothetical protein
VRRSFGSDRRDGLLSSVSDRVQDLLTQLVRNSQAIPTIDMMQYREARAPPDESGSLEQPAGISTKLYR